MGKSQDIKGIHGRNCPGGKHCCYGCPKNTSIKLCHDQCAGCPNYKKKHDEKIKIAKSLTVFSPDGRKRDTKHIGDSEIIQTESQHKRAAKDLDQLRKEDRRKVERWERFQQRDWQRIQKFRSDTKRHHYEKEYIKQLQDVMEAKRRIAKDAAKSKYPYPVPRRKIPKGELFFEQKDTKPYVPKPISSDIYREQSEDKFSRRMIGSILPKKRERATQEMPKKERSKNNKEKNEKGNQGDSYAYGNLPPFCLAAANQPKMSKLDRLGHKFISCYYRVCCICFCWLSIGVLVGLSIYIFLT